MRDAERASEDRLDRKPIRQPADCRRQKSMMNGRRKERSPLSCRSDGTDDTQRKREICLIFLLQANRLTVSSRDLSDKT